MKRNLNIYVDEWFGETTEYPLFVVCWRCKEVPPIETAVMINNTTPRAGALQLPNPSW